MAKERKAFNEVNDVNELKKVFQENIKYLTNGYFNPELLEYTIESLDNLTPEENKYLFVLIHELDEKMNHPGQSNKGLFHKIPTILASIIYIKDYYQHVTKYQPYELATLSRFSVINRLPEYQDSITLYTPNILKEVLNKSKDFFAHHTILIVVEKMLTENKTEQEIIEYIKNTDYKNIMIEKLKIETELKRSLGVIK